MVFDISQSMNVIDVSRGDVPLTRLEHAKQSAIDVLALMPCGTEIGLALFTGHRAFLLATPVETCANYSELSGMLTNIDWRMTWESRSEIAKGVYKSIALLGVLETQTRLIFFTDGHEAPPINPALPPRYDSSPGEIKGLLVGVGGQQAVPIPKVDASGALQGYWQADEVLHVDSFNHARNVREGLLASVTGNEHLSTLRETYLQGLAAQTGLSYHRLGNAQAFATQMRDGALGIPATITTDMRWLLGSLSLLAFCVTMLNGRKNV